MPQASKNEVDEVFEKLTERILNSCLEYTGGKRADDVSALFADNASVVGADRQEILKLLQEFSHSGIDAAGGDIRFEWSNLHLQQQEIDPEHVLIYGSVLILGTYADNRTCIRMDTELSILFGQVGGEWRILHIHHSVPGGGKAEDTELLSTLGNRVDEFSQMISALATEYSAVYMIEPETDTVRIIKLDSAIGGNAAPAESFSYSQTFRDFADSRICEEDRERFWSIVTPKALVAAFADGREKLELSYCVAKDDNVVHYSGIFIRASKPWEKLRLIAGFRNTDSVINVPLERDKELSEQHQIIGTLSDSFQNVYLVDLNSATAKTIRLGPEYDPLDYIKVKKSEYPVAQLVSAWVNARVHPDDRERMLRALDLEHVRDIMSKQKEYVGTYRGYGASAMHNFQFVIKRVNDDGMVLVGFQCIDDIIAEHVAAEKAEHEKEAAYRKAIDEQLAIVDALSRSYRNVFTANLTDGSLHAIRIAKDYGVESVRETAEHSYQFDDVVKRWLTDAVVPEDKERMSAAFSMANLRKIFAEQDEYIGTYRSTDKGQIHTYQFDFRRIGDTDNIVAGFQIIDSIVAQQQEQKEQEREYNEVMTSLSTIYSTIIKVEVDTHEYEIFNSVSLMSKVSDRRANFDETKESILSAFMAPDMRELMRDFLDFETLTERLRDTNTVAVDYRAPSGQWVQARFIVKHRDPDGAVKEVLYVVRDITTEKNRELEQQEKERELENIRMHEEHEHAEVINSLSTIYSTIFRADIETREYDILNSVPLMGSVSESRGNFDITKEKIIEAFMLPEYKAAMREFLDFDTLAERLADVNTVATDYKAPTGQWMQARFIVKRRDENGTAQEVLYVARDITEEKNRELEQQQALRTQLGIINSLAAEYKTLYLIDSRTRQWSLFKSDATPRTNGVVSRMSECSDYESAFTLFADNYVVPQDREKFKEQMRLETLLSGTQEGAISSFYYDRILEDGTSRLHCQGSVAKFTSEDGKAYIVVGFRDIHEAVEQQVHQQEVLAHALAAAQQANRAKTTFLNSMSHDIRTPMNAIIGFTALAQTHITDSAQVQDYLTKISTSSTHLLSLINDILDMSRIESGTVKLEEKAVHLPDLLHDLRIMIQGLVNSKSLNLFIDTQDVVHEDVLTDKLRLNQVLLNIVGNAIKFTQPGGDIIIRLIEKPSSVKNCATYEFSVKDNGIGMSKDFLGRIFDTFSREYSATVSGIQGSGLGMAITKNIVDMMGGTITVESEVGKGSLFTVTLDLHHAGECTHYEPIPDLLGAKALVVDDDVNTCRSVSKMLRDIKMRPEWTTSGKEAIIHAQDAAEMKDEYKVYIIDYLMPDMNGIETVRRIRKVISEDVPIIVLTAYDWADFEHEAREAGVTAFVSKPIFMSELRAVLTRPVENTEGHDEHADKAVMPDYSGKHILLAEDNELNREIAVAILEETGVSIDTVTDGDEAVAAINKAPAGTYDLILMDVQMPRMDGYTATREIRTLSDNGKANIPIVAMTANAFEEDRQKAYACGMNGHIIKPISIEAIAMVLDRIFEK